MSTALVAYKRLTTATTNTIHVGTRVYEGTAPDRATYPFQVYQVIGAEREHAMGSDPGHVHGRIQVDNYDTTASGVDLVAAGSRAALSRWSGMATGIVVDGIYLDDERGIYEPSQDDGRKRIWRVSQDYTIHHRE